MKKILSLLCLFCLAAPAMFATQKGVPAKPEHPALAAVDFFNFEAMQKGETGKTLRTHIFDSLTRDAGTAAIMKKMNEDFGTNLPESLRSVAIIHFAAKEIPALNVAQIKTDDDFSAFFDALKKQKNAGFSLEGLHFFELPQKLENIVPAIFKLENCGVFAAHSPQGDVLLIAFPREQTAKLAAAGFSANFPESDEFLAVPGVMIFRTFPEKIATTTSRRQSFPTVPAGEFLLAENENQVKLALQFFCKNPRERQTLHAFFGRLKTMIRSEAPDLKPIADAISETPDGQSLRIDINGNSRDFSKFLQWQKNRIPQKNKRDASENF